MRLSLICAGWALALIAAGLLVAGLMAAAPSLAPPGASALDQVLAQNWELARGFQHMLLAGVALLCGLASMILARLLPQAETGEDWHATVTRIASTAEAIRREASKKAPAILLALTIGSPAAAQAPNAADNYLSMLAEREAALLAYLDLCLGAADGMAKDGIRRVVTATTAEAQRATPNDDARGFYRAARAFAATQVLASAPSNAARCALLHPRIATLALTHIGLSRP